MRNDFGMHYIMDGNGNYYTLSGNNQLVVAKGRDEAAVFTLFEANQRIGDGKKSKFYHTVAASTFEETEDGNQDMNDNVINNFTITQNQFVVMGNTADSAQGKEIEFIKEEVIEAEPEYEYDISKVDWDEFANYYVFLASSAKGYQDELTKKLSDIDKEICDLLHYIELFDLSEVEELKAVDMLKDARQRRRDIKDEVSRVDYFMKSIGTSSTVVKAKGFITELKKLNTRMYFPRQLPGLFDDMQGRLTDRSLFRQNREVQDVFVEEENDFVYEGEEEEQEMRFVETVFDDKENDWLCFARQQMEFYENANQYMVNLNLSINTIDTTIEELMENIETANYNVTQGYKVFKELKELRNERKAKVQELKVLEIMTGCFDLDSMKEALAYNVDEIEKILTTTTEENREFSTAV